MRSWIIQERPYCFVSPSVFGREVATDPPLFSPAGLTRQIARRARAVPGSPASLLQVVRFHQRHTHRAGFSPDHRGIVPRRQTEMKR
ncbi:MAG: hypothetical protein QOF80_1767 [Verrucomicrobiota bacterium]